MGKVSNDGIDISATVTAGSPSANKLPGGAQGHKAGGSPPIGPSDNQATQGAQLVGQPKRPKSLTGQGGLYDNN